MNKLDAIHYVMKCFSRLKKEEEMIHLKWMTFNCVEKSQKKEIRSYIILFK